MKKNMAHNKKEKTFIFSSLEGSFTVEATLVFSIFLFSVISLMVPIRMVQIKRQVQAVMESVNEELCQIAYQLKEKETDSRERIDSENMKQRMQSENLLTLAGTSIYLKAKIKAIQEADAIEKISLTGTKVLEDGEHIDLQVQYQIKVPFSFWELTSIPITARSYKRAWVGTSGLKGESQDKLEVQDKEGVVVYVGNTYSRYHWYSDCHYLSNEVEGVLYSEVWQKTIKNKFGRYYQPCSVCGESTSDSEIVYIFSGGESYHRNKECSSLRFYIQEVEWEDVNMLGECSYCARRKYG